MRHWLSIVCLLLLSCGGSQKPQRVADPSTLIARGLVFTGGEGVRAEVIELNTGNTALIRVTGTRTEIEGKVLEHKIIEDGGRMNYATTIHGRDQYTLVREASRHGGNPSWQLYVRGSDISGMQLAYDEEASKKLDTVALYRAHEAQRDDGSLEALQRFDRKREQERHEAALAETQASAKQACGADVAVSIDWSTIDDDLLKDVSISSYCEPGLEAMRSLCEHEPARAYFGQSVKRYQCRFGSESKLTIADQTMTWAVSREGSNLTDLARDTLLAQTHGGQTLRQHIALATTKVCADEKNSRYIVFAADGSEQPGMLYGDGKTFRQVRHPDMMSPGWFFDPRHYNPQHNDNFRGLDLRSHSFVEVSEKEPTCTVVCGTDKTTLPLLPADKAASMLGSAKIEPAATPRVPHALARDRQGIYYYVDRSTEPGRERDFQLYVGPLGNVKRQAMKNVVSDSEGEIFSSSAGDLRFILGRDEVQWISGKQERKLLKVPIEENWQMIYNKLGVYFGVSLGNPCDDFSK